MSVQAKPVSQLISLHQDRSSFGNTKFFSHSLRCFLQTVNLEIQKKSLPQSILLPLIIPRQCHHAGKILDSSNDSSIERNWKS
jgi:hypothetical protein